MNLECLIIVVIDFIGKLVCLANLAADRVEFELGDSKTSSVSWRSDCFETDAYRRIAIVYIDRLERYEICLIRVEADSISEKGEVFRHDK